MGNAFLMKRIGESRISYYADFTEGVERKDACLFVWRKPGSGRVTTLRAHGDPQSRALLAGEIVEHYATRPATGAERTAVRWAEAHVVNQD